MIRYKTKDGVVVQGVTTIIGSNLGWNKQTLIGWTRKNALAGDDPTEIMKKAGDIGTIAHAMIEAHLKGLEANLSDYNAEDIARARVCYESYLTWEKNNEILGSESEIRLVSEKKKYGGTIDAVMQTVKGSVLVDFKTSSGVYSEHKIQASAYHQLALENGFEIDEVIILHLDKGGDFSEHKVFNLEKYYSAFEHCLALSQLHKEMK